MEEKIIKVEQECLDGRLDTAIKNQLIQEKIISVDDAHYGWKFVGFEGNKNVCYIVDGTDGDMRILKKYGIRDIYRYNTYQKCELHEMEITRKYY